VPVDASGADRPSADRPAGRYRRSIELYRAARNVIPGGVNSNVRLQSRPAPLFIDRGLGALLWDVDGNEYLDYTLGMGAVILGHAHPAVTEAIQRSLELGQLYAGQHEGELELALLLARTIPWVDMARLAMSGTEANLGAIRVARAATGRTRIVKFEGHYHGWADGIYLSSRPPIDAVGPPEAPLTVRMTSGQPASVVGDVTVLPWNDEDAFRACFTSGDPIAAVLLEPVLCNTALIPPDPSFIELIRSRTEEAGAILIFDEVITGFRVGLQGAAARLSVRPDLVVYGKAMGNGVPVACFAGSSELMSLVGDEVAQHLGTYNGNRISVSAAIATIQCLSGAASELYPRLEYLGNRLGAGLRHAAAEAGVPATVIDYAGIVHTALYDGPAARDYRQYVTSEDFRALARFVDGLQDRGVRITNRGTWFLSASHSEQDIDRTVERSFETFEALARLR